MKKKKVLDIWPDGDIVACVVRASLEQSIKKMKSDQQ